MSHHLRLFGYPALLDEHGQPLPFKSRKQLAVLVCLALEAREQPVSRQLLTAYFWPDVPPARAGHSLSQALGAIRERLGKDSVTHRGDPVLLLAPLPTDLDLLREGKELPGGFDEPLKGLELAGTPEFVSWVDATRSRCARVAREVLSERLHAARFHGDARRVHEHAAQLYRVDPVASSSVCVLAEQLLLEGDTSGSQRLLRSYLERAPADLGEDDVREVGRLLRRVEKSAVRPAEEPDPLTRRALARRREVFVGRTEELALLEQRWSEARLGKLVTCLVAGPAGIGKSTLLRRFAASLDKRTAPVVEIACQEIGRNIPFAAVSDLVHALSRDGAASGTEARWLAEASRVCPRLGSMYPNIPDPPEAPAESVRFRVAEALLQMWDTVTEGGPGLLVIDDIPNLDQASRDVMYVFFRRLSGRPLLLLASSRTTVAQSPTISTDEVLSGMDWDEAVTLSRLSRSHVTDLIASLSRPHEGIPTEATTTLADLAAGNPYLVEILYSDWQHNGSRSLVALHAQGSDAAIAWQPPEMMRRAFAHQHRGLSDDADRMLCLLAITGRPTIPTCLGNLLGLKRSQADRAAIELLDHGIVRSEAGGLIFKNQLHRDFVYGSMAPGTRSFHHSQVAQATHNSAGAGDFQLYLEAAHHFRLAGSHLQAIALTIEGAERAIESGAPKEAERAARQLLFLEGCDASSVHRLIAEAQLAQGQHRAALLTLAAVPDMDAASKQAAHTAVLKAEALHRGRLADPPTVSGAAETALSSSLAAGDDAAVLRALQVTAEVAHDSADTTTINRIRSDCAKIHAETQTPEIKASASMTQAYCAMVLGDYGVAAELFAAGAAGFRSLGRDIDLRRALNGLGMCLSTSGDSDGAIRALREAVLLAEKIGDSHAESIQWDNLAVLYEDLGWFDRAAEAYRRALTPHHCTPAPPREAQILANAASLAVTLGNIQEARTFLDRAVSLARTTQLPGLTIATLVARSDLHIADSDHNSAWAWADEAIVLAAKHPDSARRIGDFERLRRHFVWATQGYDAFTALCRQVDANRSEIRQSQVLERLAFEEWVHQVEGCQSAEASATIELVRRRLFGAVAHLVALNVYPGSLPARQSGETSAQLVIRAFPECRPGLVPTDVGALQ